MIPNLRTTVFSLLVAPQSKVDEGRLGVRVRVGFLSSRRKADDLRCLNQIDGSTLDESMVYFDEGAL